MLKKLIIVQVQCHWMNLMVFCLKLQHGKSIKVNAPLPPTAGILEEGYKTPRDQEASSWVLGHAFCGVPGCCWGPPWPTGRSTAGWFPWVCVAWSNPFLWHGPTSLPKRERWMQWRYSREKNTHSNTSLSWLRAHVYDHYSKHSLHTSPVYCIKHIVYSDRNLFFYWNVCRSDFFQRSVSDTHYAGVLDLFPL